MKFCKLSLIISFVILLSSCTNMPENDVADSKNITANAVACSEVMLRSDDMSTDAFKNAKKDYYNYVIETLATNNYVKKDGSADGLGGLEYALKRCTYDIDEPLGKREITPIVQNPDNGLFVATFDYGGWRVELLLICFQKGQISLIKEIGEVNRDATSMVSLNGFNEKFIQTYTATNMGNGTMKLITFDKDARLVGTFPVVDYHFERIQNTNIINRYNLDKSECVSNIFGDIDDTACGYLIPEYVDINHDGYDDLQFTGMQSLYDSRMGKVDETELVMTYLFDTQSKVFLLGE